MRTKQGIKNTVSNLILQIVLALSGILIPQFFTALYGSPVNGLVSSISQFISYISLVEAGVGLSSTAALYRPLADRDTKRIDEIVSAARVFYNRSGCVFLLLIAALVAFYPIVVESEIQDTGFIRMMILVLSVTGLVDYFFLGKYRVLLQADQRGYVISIIQIIGTIVMTVVSIVFIELEMSAIAVKAVNAVVYVLRSAAVAGYVRLHYPQIHFHAQPDMAALNQRWSALVHQIASLVVNNTDVVILTLLVPQNALVEVSVYTVYNLVAAFLVNVTNAFTDALSPSFGQVLAREDTAALRRSYDNYEYLYLIFSFIIHTCLAVLLYPFIALYTATFADGQVYLRWSLVVLFTCKDFLQSVRIPQLTMITAAGHYKQTQGSAILEAVINLGVSLLLVRRWGIDGVLVGTCASHLYRSIYMIVYSAKHFLPGTIKKTLRRLGRNAVVVAALIVAGLYVVPADMGSWLGWFLYAAGFAAACCVVVGGVNFLLEPRECKACVSRFKSLLHRRGRN